MEPASPEKENKDSTKNSGDKKVWETPKFSSIDINETRGGPFTGTYDDTTTLHS